MTNFHPLEVVGSIQSNLESLGMGDEVYVRRKDWAYFYR